MPFQAVDALAGRPDADGELACEVRDPAAGVLMQEAQELELRGDDPVPVSQPVVERTKAGVDPIFTRDAVRRTGAMYLADQDPRQPLLSPAILADLTGFPPMLLQVGANELLLDDATRLAARARMAEVDVILDVTADVPHVFQSFAGVLDEADDALARAAFFLGQRVQS